MMKVSDRLNKKTKLLEIIECIKKNEKNKMRLKIYFYALLIFTLDIFTKSMVIHYGNVLTNKEVIPNFFYIYYSTNTGGAFSILKDYMFLIIILSFIVLFYIDRYLIKTKMNKLQIIATTFLIGGIVGNLFDRIFLGNVIDFLSFIIFNYHFPVFNVADIFICLGSFVLIIDIIRGEVHEYKNKR